MKDIEIKGDMLEKIITDAIPAIFKEKFSSTYSNPIATIIEEEIKSNEGSIRIFIRDQITKILTNKKFQDKITQEVVGSIIAKGLGTR